MSLVGRAIKVVGRAANPLYRLTPKRKAALAKAIKASAAARSKGKKPGLLKKAARGVVRYGERVQGVSSVNFRASSRVAKMGLKKNAFWGMASGKQFRGKAGRALRKATYNDRLQAGRQAFRERSFVGRGVRNLLGNRYDTLTFGENFRRNIARSIKVNTATVGAKVAVIGGVAAGSEAARGISQAADAVMSQIRRYKNDKSHTPRKAGR